MEARAVRLAARRAGDHQVAGLARPARVAVACAEVAFAVPGAVLRARVLRTKAAVFSAEAWLAEAFADLAEAVAVLRSRCDRSRHGTRSTSTVIAL